MWSTGESLHAERPVCMMCPGWSLARLPFVTCDDVLDRSVFAFVDVTAVLHLLLPELLDQLLLLPLVLMGRRLVHAKREEDLRHKCLL